MSSPVNTGRPTSRPPRHEFAGLDVLRLIACLAVMTYHFTFRGTAHDALAGFAVPSVQAASKYGFLGVHLFFVISGFVIAYSAMGRSPGQFFLARLIRIYPAFLICMAISFAAVRLFGAPLLVVTWPQLLANTAIVAPAFGQKFVDGAYWSIVCELVFYGWVLGAKRLRLFDTHLPALIAGWIAISFANELLLHQGALSMLLLTPYSGFFAMGVALYQGRFFGWTRTAIALTLASTLLAATQLVADFRYHTVQYATAFSDGAAVAFVVAMLLVVAACVTLDRGGPRRAAFLLVGGITYPLYLLHQNLGYLALNKLAIGLPPEVVVTLVEAVLVALAWAVWRFAEQPARRMLKAHLGRRAAHAPAQWIGGMRHLPRRRPALGEAATLPRDAP